MIVAAAIKDEDGRVWSLPKPNRHGNIIRARAKFGLCQNITTPPHYRLIDGYHRYFALTKKRKKSGNIIVNAD